MTVIFILKSGVVYMSNGEGCVGGIICGSGMRINEVAV